MHHRVKLGDTIVEVTFAIAVFAFVAIISISLMNSGMSKAQAALEITMARNEIDAQAEALRFIHNSFLSERNLSREELELNTNREGNKWYAQLWQRMTRDATSTSPNQTGGLANMPNKVAPFNVESCHMAYEGWSDGTNTYPSLYNNNAFVLNTRILSPNTVITGGNNNVIYIAKDHTATFTSTPLYPRIIFTNHLDTKDSDEMTEGVVADSSNISLDKLYRYISRVEGIWVISVRDATKFANITSTNYTPTPGDLASKTPEYFDFHIRTCWYAPGRDIPTTIGTIIRLYNPEYVETSR